MTAGHETSPAPGHLANGNANVERLETLVRQLREECDRLRQALAELKVDRDRYRHLFLEQARAAREFEDLDIPTLEAMSAGSVDKIE